MIHKYKAKSGSAGWSSSDWLPLAGKHHLLAWLVFLTCCSFPPVFLNAQTSPNPPSPVAAQGREFNRDILPILSENCFYCHGPDSEQRQSEWRLDERASALAAGIIAPGDPASSELIARINAADSDLLMPPPDSHRQLTLQQKQVLTEWISQGATYQQHWAFTPPERPSIPKVTDEIVLQNPIDIFLHATRQRQGLQAAAEADRPTLIKRLYADLVGLPPSPQQVAAFVQDQDPQAFENLVAELLASPHFGERMALPWLDAARYADSNGFQQDGDTWQWIWRDWVVDAYNRDLPFDQFSIWQLAGDLLPEATTEQKIASAFNRNHLLNGEGGAIAEEQRFVGLFDRVDTTATNWLGLTMACAQCHDHKYDPITQRDYYGLLDAFNRVNESGVPRHFSARIRVDTPFLELPTPENEKRISHLERDIAQFEFNAAIRVHQSLLAWRVYSAYRARNLRQELDQYRNDQLPRLMIMSDAQPRTTHILNRGAYLSPLEPVSFDTPSCLPPLPPDFPRNRLGFARWLFLPDHPLTARVHVNRIWQHFFGQGLVRTAEDFGVQSEYPVQRELLDWLACEFRDGGWSVKHIVRLIVTSQAYRQSSKIQPDKLELDPLNIYWARGPRIRMPAMVLRDWALASAGLLQRRIGGVPVYPYQPDAVWESLAITKERDFTYPKSQGNDLYRRSLYTFWRRTVSPANMFDASNRQACRVRTSITSTPLHALTMLNDPTWTEAARVLAQRCLEQHRQDSNAAVRLAFMTVLCREPTSAEKALLLRALDKQRQHYQSDPNSAELLVQVGASEISSELDVSEWAALSQVCLGLFNLDEAMTRE